MKKLLAVLAFVALGLAVTAPELAQATTTLPNYAAGADVKSTLESKGKAITDIISLVIAIISIMAIMVGGGYFAAGNSERGKTFVIGGMIGILLTGLAYGIAALVAA